jgi:hypothetical protein
MAAACARPLNVLGSSLELDKPLHIGENKIAIPNGKGQIVNRVTPEQLLAIVASLIASSPDAQTACTRLRAEVIGWQFQDAKGNSI